MARSLTPKQAQALSAFAELRDERGLNPTYKELAVYMGLSKATVYESIDACVRKGYMTRAGASARGLEIADGVEIPGRGPSRVALLERECTLMARFIAGRITDPKDLEECDKLVAARLAATASPAGAARFPAWIQCPDGCGDMYCTKHGKHTSECPCPSLEAWRCLFLDPYAEGGKPVRCASAGQNRHGPCTKETR